MGKFFELNLQQQVQYLTDRVEEHYNIDRVVAEFGIKILGSVNYVTDIPPSDTYEYGDAYIVKKPSQAIYVWTRANPAIGKNEPYFLNIGNLAVVGPEGPEGPAGPQGDPGTSSQWYVGKGVPTSSTEYTENDMYLNIDNGDVYQYSGSIWTFQTNIKGPQGVQGIQGPRGIQGERGPQGPTGPKGDAGGFITIVGTLNSTNELPTPQSLNNLTYAYLVRHTGGTDQTNDHYDLYIQVGNNSDTALWENMGPFNAATLVTVNGEGQIVWNADTKLDKITSSGYVKIYVANADGTQGQRNLATTAAAAKTGALTQYFDITSTNGNNEVTGTLLTAIPQLPYQAANKQYVDDAIANINVSGGGSSTGGTTVYVGGNPVETWDADTKLTKPTVFESSGLMRYNPSSKLISRVSTYSSTPSPGYVATCDSASCLTTSTPTKDYHCATKKYVDDAIAGGSSGGGSNKVYVHTIEFDGSGYSYIKAITRRSDLFSRDDYNVVLVPQVGTVDEQFANIIAVYGSGDFGISFTPVAPSLVNLGVLGINANGTAAMDRFSDVVTEVNL